MLEFSGVMTDVKIFVSSSSNIDVDGISCAHVAEIAESAKVEAACHSPRFGRYVSIQYTNMAPKTVTQSLCEIVSVGHPIPGKHDEIKKDKIISCSVWCKIFCDLIQRILMRTVLLAGKDITTSSRFPLRQI